MEIPLRVDISASSILIYGVLFSYGVYYTLVQVLDLPLLSPPEILWNALVYVIPTRLLLDTARRQELRANDMLSQTHAAKADALRRVLGMGGNAIMQSLPSTGEAIGMRSMMRRASTNASAGKTSGIPAGLGNWDNSCYQNSVLQALSSLGSLRTWLGTLKPEGAETTSMALHEMIARLRDPANNGKHIWTPAKLKSMSSWQQQDAQEYFSKLMDELDKEAVKAFTAKEERPGLETILEKKQEIADQESSQVEEKEEQVLRNPLEGLVAQRVACTRCGFSEGYSMIPFNCLTVPLGSRHEYDLANCLDEYTQSEDIEGVECRSCTLLQNQAKLRQLQLPPELRAQIERRLEAIEAALEKDDFSDKTLKQDCLIPAKAFVSSTKSKEAIIGRAPKSFVVHINRSVFDPMTGIQRKNYAQVRYPLLLDLGPWMLGTGYTPANYRLSAVVTHYGRHENGHYICYRRHPRLETLDNTTSSETSISETVEEEQEGWWRLSDEDVSTVSEQDALSQGGVFMLFYERIDSNQPPPREEPHPEAAAVPLPPDEATDWEMMGVEASSTATPSLVTSSTAHSVVSESDTEYERDEQIPLPRVDGQKLPLAPVLKTSAPSPGYTLPSSKDITKHDIGMNRSMMSV